jgi:hypothetical protein
MADAYRQPLERLLKLGSEPALRRVWPDYRHLGLTERHVPGLVDLATGSALLAGAGHDRASWAPIHAWRALGQLRATLAAPLLLALLEREAQDAWVFGEVPMVLGMIGPAALAGATLLLFDEGHPEAVRTAGARTITEVAHEHPERRDEAVALLSKQLEDWARQGPILNGFLVGCLVELDAGEAAPVMEAAFAAGAVDLTMMGDWEDVQVELGLLEQRITRPTPWSPVNPELDLPLPGGSRPRGAAEKARERRKAEKQSRKRNRRRK